VFGLEFVDFHQCTPRLAAPKSTRAIVELPFATRNPLGYAVRRRDER
jgi:hypothetical protein